jgi:hypothetical protein
MAIKPIMLFFSEPLKGWRGVVAYWVGCVGKKHGFTFDKKCGNTIDAVEVFAL